MNTRSLMKPSFWNLVFIVLSIHTGLFAEIIGGCNGTACGSYAGCLKNGRPGICQPDCTCLTQPLEGEGPKTCQLQEFKVFSHPSCAAQNTRTKCLEVKHLWRFGYKCTESHRGTCIRTWGYGNQASSFPCIARGHECSDPNNPPQPTGQSVKPCKCKRNIRNCTDDWGFHP